MWNEFVPGETGFTSVWVFSVELARNRARRTCVMEAKQRNHMLTPAGQGWVNPVFQIRLWDTKLRCKGGLVFTPGFAACWQLMQNDSSTLAERPASALLVACGHLWNLR